MGIESDQLVFDYLSRVGDLAQQHQLNSGDRMRLVAALRGEIDRQRSKAIGGPDSAATVQRILGRLGTPDEVVEAAGGGGVEAVLSSRTSRRVPRQRRTEPDPGTARGREPERERGPEAPVGFEKEPRGRPGKESWPLSGPSAPHLAGRDELGDGEADWWRTEPGPFGGLGTSVPGFTGGVEIPEILKPPPEDDENEDEDRDEDEEEEEGDYEDEDGGRPAGGRRLWRRLRGRPRAAVVEAEVVAAPVRAAFIPRGSPFLLLAAVLLITGAVLGNVLVLGGGWFLAYFSRRLSRTEAKWAVLGLPGLVAVGGVVWLWGRTDGRWGPPLSTQVEGALNDAIIGLWPVLLRTAAVVTALYLVWRARRLGR
ncbi:hypothetical protein ACIQM4_14020 [Streptomyces sp. NPDC091272]|uniref:hypothetical protein n=1 Tax=Streptomyces sp. NPDC091272 TaxID=3365981 RepID=UPI00381365A2